MWHVPLTSYKLTTSDATQAGTKLIDLQKIAKDQIDWFSENCQISNDSFSLTALSFPII